MAEVNANIGVQIDTSQALAQLKNLQREISLFHTSIAKSSATAAAAQRNLQTDFLNAINATGKFAAEFRTIKTASESFTTSLEKNKFSMREYFRYAGAATTTFGKLFRTEFDTINKVAEDRVKRLQTQYIKMGRDASGALKAIAVTPLALDMNNLHTQTMIAAQRQQLFNELLSKGTTNLINFGKNTQWAGRQLMVGFSIPLSIFGSQASKIFMDIEQQALRFKRVYGDLLTSKSETNANLTAIRGLAQEYTKYGVAVRDTLELAANAAAAGMQGAKLQETVRQATKLSVLGEVDKQQAFQATISLQTAFQMSNEELAQSIDFLNAVENQSVTSLQDLTDAIPKVAPVIRGLGGDVKDMAVFLTAMKEGGVDAASAANGLKSALASMINPTKAAKEMLAGVGINIQEIATRNKGNIMRTVLELGDALKGLEPMARTQVLEKLFGKYQFARVSALFDNISKSGSQAQRTMELMSMSASDLARISNKELTSIEENAAVKFKAAVESLKGSLAPVGETFLTIVTPILEFITKVADKFSGLSDHTKKVIAVIVTVIGGIAPVVLMLVGLFANFFGQLGKFFAMLRNGYLGLTGQSKVLGEQTGYLTTQQMDAAAVAHSLDQIHAKLTQRFTVEAEAVAALSRTYMAASAAAERFTLANPGMMIPGRGKKLAGGGVVSGPGTDTSDSIPAMLSNGEAVIPAKNVKKYPGLVAGLVAGNIPGFKIGTVAVNTSNIKISDIPMDFARTSTGTFMQKFIDALIKNTSNIQQTERVLAETLTRLSTQVGVSQRDILREFDVVSENMTGSRVNNAVYKDTNQERKYSASIAGVPALEEQVKGFTNQPRIKEEMARANVAASAVEAELRKRGATEKQITELTHSVRAHVIEVTNAEKLLAQSWGEQAMVVQTQVENEMSTQLTYDKNRNEFNAILAQTQASEELKLSMQQKITRNIALNEEELQLQATILKRMVANPAVMSKVTPGFGLMAHGTIAAADARFAMGAPTAGAGSRTTQEIADVQQRIKTTLYRGNNEFIGVVRTTALQALQTLRNTFRVASASKETDSVGQEIDNGLIQGMKKRKAAVLAQSRLIASEAVATMRATANQPVQLPQLQFMPGFGPGMPNLGDQMGIGQKAPGKFADFASKFKGKGMAVGMGASALAIGGSMLPGKAGEFAQKLIPATMALQAFGMALPMLMNPIGATVAALGGLAFLIYKTNKAYEAHIQAIKDSAKAEVARKYGSSTVAQDYAKFTGQKLPSMQQFNRVGSARFISADLAKQESFKEFYNQKGSTSTKAIMGAKAQDRTGAVAANIAQMAAVNALNPQDIAAAIKAASSKFGTNELQVKAKLQALLAPGGKDILTTPLTIDARLNFLKSTADKQLADLQNRIGKLVPKEVGSYAGDRAGAQAAAARIQKEKETQIRDSAVASELLKKSFFDQTQALSLLNQEYTSGTISQEEYNKQFDILRGNMDKVVSSTSNLVTAMDKFDTSGKTSKALLSDMTDTILKMKDVGKETTKLVKNALSTMPSKVQTDIMIGLAAGSLEPTDILIMQDMFENMKGKTYEQKIEILNTSKNGLMEGTIAQIEKAILTTRKLEIVTAKEKAAREGASSAKIQQFNTQLKDIDDKIAAADRKIKGLEKITPPTTQPDGTQTLGDGDAEVKQEATTLDGIIAKFRELDKANQKLTEGWAKSKSALKNIFKGLKPGLGLEELIRKKGGSQDFIDLVLGMSPADFEKHKKELFNFDKAGKNIVSLTGFAKNLGKVLSQLTFSGIEQSLKAVSRDTVNQSIATRKLAASGMDYADALNLVKTLSPQALNEIASTDMANKKWQSLMETIRKTNAEMMNNSVEYAMQSIINKADVGLNYISTQADALRAAAEAQLKADKAAVEDIQDQINVLQRKIEMQFDRPIAALQSKSNILNNDLNKIAKQEEKINEEFDKQQKALDAISKVNQQIIAQNKQQISLADAITSGDMSAAAQAIQDMRASNASNAAESQQSMMDAARQNALNNVTENGKTRKQIEEQLYAIGQQIFALEQQKEAVLNSQLTPLQDQLYSAQEKLSIDQKQLQAAIDRLTYDGLTVTQLDLMKANAAKALVEYQKVATAAGQTAASAAAADASIKSYAKTLAGLKDKTVTITTIYNNIINNTTTNRTINLAHGGFVKKMASGGSVLSGYVPGNGILDTVPAMLTPGEFVVNRKAAKAYAPLLESINSQSYPEIQGRVNPDQKITALSNLQNNALSNNLNHYSVNVSLNGTNMNADDVANTVIRKIKLMDRNNIRRSNI